MKKPAKEMSVTELRQEGYAVVMFAPEELSGVEPSTLQNRLVELGNEAIDDLSYLTDRPMASEPGLDAGPN
jgi:hypothetical protein